MNTGFNVFINCGDTPLGGVFGEMVGIIVRGVQWLYFNLCSRSDSFSNSGGVLCEDCSNNILFNVILTNLAKSCKQVRGGEV